MIIKNNNYNNKNENNNITMYSHCFLTQFCTDDIYTHWRINTLILLFLCLNFPCRSHQKKQIIIMWLLFILWLFFMFMLRTVPVHPPQTWKATAHTTFSMRPCNATAGTACNSNNNIYNCYGFYSGSLFSTPEHEKKVQTSALLHPIWLRLFWLYYMQTEHQEIKPNNEHNQADRLQITAHNRQTRLKWDKILLHPMCSLIIKRSSGHDEGLVPNKKCGCFKTWDKVLETCSLRCIT